MYAINDDLRGAWRALHDIMAPELKKAFATELMRLRFDTDSATLNHKNMLIGQTCGYPLVTQYNHSLTPVCVPQFNVDGCERASYSSVLIGSAKSDFQSLVQYRNQVAVINSADSNSGMNMFRSELAPLIHNHAPFFAQTLVSGSHLKSVQIVAQGVADIAAIDCVTFAYIADAIPDLISQIKILGYTKKTMGLPFVVPHHRFSQVKGGKITKLFNHALNALQSNHRKRLRITQFSDVTLVDYKPISEIDRVAVNSGHHALKL